MGHKKTSKKILNALIYGSILWFLVCFYFLLSLKNDTMTGQAKEEFYCKVYDIRSSPTDTHQCINVTWEQQHPFICVHDPEKDIYVSRVIAENGEYEPEVMEGVRKALVSDPELAFIDIGANLGQFTLLAASMHRSVVAVEARHLHVQMIHHSLVKNDLVRDDIVVLHNAVLNVQATLDIQLVDFENQGNVEFVRQGSTNEFMNKLNGIQKDEKIQVTTIKMDDLIEVIKFEKAVIRMDIQGNEAKALSSCEQLLDQVYVPYIIMEWSWQRDLDQEQINIIEVMERLDYRPLTLQMGSLHYELARTWPDYVIWKREDAPYL